MQYAQISERQIVRAMQFHEKKHIAAFGPLDGVNLPVAVSKLADLLGVLWFEKETTAQVAFSGPVAALLVESGHTLEVIEA